MHHYTVDFAEAVEVADIHTAVVSLKCAEDGLGRYAGLFGLGHVDVHLILREGGVEGGIGHLDFGLPVELCQEVLDNREECVDVASGTVLHLDFEAVGGAVARNHGRCEDYNIAIFDDAKSPI